MAFRLTAARLSIFKSLCKVTENITRVPAGEFFTEKAFFGKANTGPFWIALLSAPCFYQLASSYYWTRQFAKVEAKEIVADRYAWLYERFLDDEVNAVLKKSANL